MRPSCFKFTSVIMSALMLILPFASYSTEYEVNVSTQPASSLSYYPEYQVLAKVISLRNATLRSETHGRVTHLHYLVGQKVKKGEVIARLDCVDQKANLDQAVANLAGNEAQVEFVEWQLSQARTLAEQSFSSKEHTKALEAQLRARVESNAQLKALAEYQSHQVKRCTITAPFTGVITERSANLGDYMQPGAPMVQLLSNEVIETQAFIHPKEMERLQTGQRMVFVANEKTYPLELRAPVASINPNTHTQEVRFRFTDQRPLPGTVGKVVWQDTRAHLPARLLESRNKQLGLFVKQGNHAKFLTLNNAQEGQPFLIDKPLNGAIIVEGKSMLDDGVRVSITSKDTQGDLS